MCRECETRYHGIVEKLISGYDNEPARKVLHRGFREVGKCPAMRELENITPPGHKVWEEPTYAAKLIRGYIKNQKDMYIERTNERDRFVMECVRLKLEVADLKQQIEDLKKPKE